MASAGLVFGGTAVPASADPAPAPTDSAGAVRYVNSVALPNLPTIDAISGIESVGGGRYDLISNDTGRTGLARTYTIGFPVDAAGQIYRQPSITGVGAILAPGNLPILPGTTTPRGIRKLGADRIVVGGGEQPFARVVGPVGNHLRELVLPRADRAAPAARPAGIRGLSGVAVSSGNRIAILNAGLRGDPVRSARVLFPTTGNEYFYRPDAGMAAADILAINATDYLILERGNGRSTRIFWSTVRGADQVKGKPTLTGREEPMPKKRIFDVAALPGLAAGKISGMTWGPWLSVRKSQGYQGRSLVLVTDDAHAGPTRLHALEYRHPRG